MSSASWLAFSSFMEEKDPELYLEKPLLEKFRALPATLGDFSQGIPKKSQILSQIHYSWITTFLGNFVESDQLLFLSPFSEVEREKMKSNLGIEGKVKELSPIASAYIENQILGWVLSDKKEFLVRELLPQDPLNEILDLEKDKLLEMVDLLGLYDLASDLKKVIDKSKLKAIDEMLTPHQHHFLKRIMQEKDRLKVPSLGLTHWDGNPQKLRNLLHSRGLNRLAKALFYASPALLLHVMLKIDRSRANSLKKYCVETHDEEAKRILQQQVLQRIGELL